MVIWALNVVRVLIYKSESAGWSLGIYMYSVQYTWGRYEAWR